jgi:hypothetical protein
VSFGLWNRGWTKVRYPANPSLGNIEADFFEPGKWKTEYPQPAFDQMDAADAFWAASIASRFTNPMIEAIVATGELSDPDAARYLTNVIIRRRDKVVAYWIGQTNPLDRFAVVRTPMGAELTFDNAALRLDVAQPSASYKARWFALDNAAGAERPVGDELSFERSRIPIPNAAWGPPDGAGIRYAVVAISTVHEDHPNWATPVVVTVRDRRNTLDVVGIERTTEARSAPVPGEGRRAARRENSERALMPQARQ